MSAEPEQPGTAPPVRSPLAGRRRVTLLVAVACAVVSIGGLIAATAVKSPAQLAAETEPPAPSVLTATVERRVLERTLITRGTTAAARQVSVVPLGSTQGAAVQVVTALHTAVGKEVKPGQVLLEVSGRPLIALAGRVPLYRDLRPADDGADVRQLQAALRSLGHYHGGDREGFFGSSTKTAVRRLYTSRGYRVPDTGGLNGADAEPLRAKDAAVRAARAALAAASDASATVRRDLRLQLELAEAARDDLVARTGPMLPLAEVAVLPGFPGRVTEIAAKVGDTVKDKLITVAAGRLEVIVKLPPTQAGLIKAGLPVELVADLLGEQAKGTVASIGAVTTEASGGGGPQGTGADAGAPYVPVVIVPAKPLDPAWSGLDVRVTIASAQTPGPVLVVPLSAVSSAANGRTTVSKLSETGQATRVEVRAGAVGDGYVHVTPTNVEALDEGDIVVVGA